MQEISGRLEGISGLVQEISDLVDEISGRLKETSGLVQEILDLVDEISRRLKETSGLVQEILDLVDEISRRLKETSGLAQEILDLVDENLDLVGTGARAGGERRHEGSRGLRRIGRDGARPSSSGHEASSGIQNA